MILLGGYEIYFVSYPFLILLISGQTIKVTVAQNFLKKLNILLAQNQRKCYENIMSIKFTDMAEKRENRVLWDIREVS